MGVTISGTLSAPGAFGQAIERFGRRSISQQLRRQGELAGDVALAIADSDLGPSRQGNRSRSGVSYRDSFSVEYTGFEDFGHGNMTVSVRNEAPHARWIEEGSPGSEITGRLRWPFAPYATPGPPWAFQTRGIVTVSNQGFTGYRILERAARRAILERLGGKTLGHARIRIRST